MTDQINTDAGEDRRQRDTPGAEIYPGKRMGDVAKRAARQAAVCECGGITVKGPVIIYVAPSQDRPAGTIGDIVRQMTGNQPE